MGAKRKQKEVPVKYGRIAEAQARYSLGRETVKKVAKDAGATVKVGKALLFDFEKLDTYLESMRGSD